MACGPTGEAGRRGRRERERKENKQTWNKGGVDSYFGTLNCVLVYPLLPHLVWA